ELSIFRRYLGGNRDIEARALFEKNRPGLLFVAAIGMRVDKANTRRPHFACTKDLRRLPHITGLQGDYSISPRVFSLLPFQWEMGRGGGAGFSQKIHKKPGGEGACRSQHRPGNPPW